MTALDWTALGLGGGLGFLSAAVFFAGLAWGMRIALRQARPAPVLALSAVVRIAALLATGWWVAGQGASALAGFALAFMAARLAVVSWARPAREGDAAPWR
jgi:hypothetical protein